MSLMLKRGIEVLVGAALVVAILVVFPAVAEAQSVAATQDGARATNRGAADAAPATRVVVRPGDSLWLISEERLGSKATPQQIATVVEQIYARNRDQIGADPNLIFPGQRLLVPPVAGATPARNDTEPTQKNQTARATKSAPDRTPSSTVGEADSKVGEARDAVGEQAHLPDMDQPAPVPAASPLAPSEPSHSPVESLIGKARAAVSAATSAATSVVAGLVPRDGFTGRQLLGVALFTVSSTLALVGTLLIARELLANQGREERRAREDYAASYPLLENEEKTGGVGNGISTAHTSNGAYPAGIFAAARRRRARLRRPVRPQRPARHVRKGLATGAHSPDVRRMLRRRGVGRR